MNEMKTKEAAEKVIHDLKTKIVHMRIKRVFESNFKPEKWFFPFLINAHLWFLENKNKNKNKVLNTNPVLVRQNGKLCVNLQYSATADLKDWMTGFVYAAWIYDKNLIPLVDFDDPSLQCYLVDSTLLLREDSLDCYPLSEKEKQDCLNSLKREVD
jgi:hypothetical protein